MAEANYAEAVAQQDVISELLGKCFAARTVFEQKDIFEIPFLRSFIPEGRTSFLILASPLSVLNTGYDYHAKRFGIMRLSFTFLLFNYVNPL